MSPLIAFPVLVLYFGVLMLVARLTARRDNAGFFLGNRHSPWFVVAFGMIGASLSGISVVSVPSMVGAAQFTYLQTVLGFFFGYLVVALVLLPIYYRLQLTSIYGYLRQRFGAHTHHTGAWLFIVAKMISAATKLYVAVIVLQQFIFNAWHVPFFVTTTVCVLLIWLYTRRGGMRTIVWTDLLQTVFILVAVGLMLIEMVHLLGNSLEQTINTVANSAWSRIFVFDDWKSNRNFWKQFMSGIFIVVVMTGLDQDMMQKNLSCKTLRQSQRNMLCYGAAFLPVNLLLLFLGALLLIYAAQSGLTLPTRPDEILPLFATSIFGHGAALCFLIGITAASFSSADSALTAITTTFAVDILGVERHPARQAERLRRQIHLVVCVLFVVVVQLLCFIGNQSIIDTIYTIVGYAYGPLLGLFAYGLCTQLQLHDRWVPLVALLSPLFTFAIQTAAMMFFDYKFGYELLMLNGLLTFVGLLLISKHATPCTSRAQNL